MRTVPTETSAAPRAPAPRRRPLQVPYRVAGVTGTNGKTTTATMLEAIAAHAGDASGRVTTLGSWVRGEQVSDDTSEASMARTLDAARQRAVRTMVMETTSLALLEGFADALPATVGVFTSFSRDHLDYHGTPEEYLAAKAQLFIKLLPGGTAVLNAADPASALLEEVCPPGVRRLGYAGRPVDPACASLPLALAAERVEVDRRGTRVTLAPSPLAERLGGALALRVVGHVHAENALAAAVAADALGYPPGAIREALAAFAGVTGRFQVVARDGGPLVVVDYAHTPDALERTLTLARGLVEAGGRVFCVFGCGGDRDRGKRPEMGRVASRLADVVVVTTDNPRGEAPDSIADMILSGIPGPLGKTPRPPGAEGRNARPLRILDRARAIRRAISLARAPDIVVVAGKGHEKTQVFRGRVIPFDDVEVARSAPSAAGGEQGRKSRT